MFLNHVYLVGGSTEWIAAIVSLLAVAFIPLAIGIAAYVLQSLGLYTIANRRGISNPWLAWLPVGNMWILGSIADQYQYAANHKVRNRRNALLTMTVILLALCCIFVMIFLSMFFALGSSRPVC